MQIDRSNYEIWIIDWLDGNLNSSQVGQLNLFLDQNQDLREEFNDLTSVEACITRYLIPEQRKFKKITFRYYSGSVRIPVCSIP